MSHDKSPFFAPSTPRVIAQTPGGTKRSIKKTVEENKSSVVGAMANLINAIVGAGIVGIPFAIQQAGLVAGVVLVCICALLTDKSLRLLVETAKHASTPSYETTMEAAFGRPGFLFVCINMFIMSYGAMVSYLMIVKETLPYVFGISDLGSRRALLFLVSLLVMVPLSSQRDMANLAQTSRISVCLDIVMVGLVAYIAPISATLESHGGFWNLLQQSTLRIDTVFVGLGVLSFAFVCQHSAFIIAGSLEQPTKERWSCVTLRALWVCALLANLCGITGYLGYMDDTQGNILNNLPQNGLLPNAARGLLGVTMLFVYPMESFVARHVCVVTFFAGRRAHEGDDATILNRRDRRIGLTVTLYILALVPALLFENLGSVLSVTGAIGGSCLSYIGPGALYLGIHGGEFVKMAKEFWNMGGRQDLEMQPLRGNSAPAPQLEDSNLTKMCKTILWYLLGMPVWYNMAKVGAEGFSSYKQALVLKSPHPSRLGKVKRRAGPACETITRSGSNPNITYQGGPQIAMILPPTNPGVFKAPPRRILQQQQQEEEEDDPQESPQLMDFVIAVSYMLFGLVALSAGLLSIFAAQGR
jgi:sodium-coupled neutral amino acid transporter 11